MGCKHGFLILSLVFALSMAVAQTDIGLKFSLQSKALEAKEFAKSKQLDTTRCILIDMSIHSGKYRLFVYDLLNDSVVGQGLCAHGDCRGQSMDTARFSNIPNSHCSSIGRYKIGKRSYSNWGVNYHYKLHGLDGSNDNVYKRIIVLHSFQWVEDEEVYPDYCMTSWGCPMVSDRTMIYLDTQIKATKKPMLLWVYN